MLRDRGATDRAVERALEAAAARSPDAVARVLVNDRLPLAVRFPVAGVHLPEAGLPVAAVRGRFPRGAMRVGRSAHSPDAARAAEADGADFVMLGPAFPTGRKRTPLAVAAIRAVCAAARVPVWVVGGLDAGRVLRLGGLGISGFAAISAFRDPDSARGFMAAVRELGGRLE